MVLLDDAFPTDPITKNFGLGRDLGKTAHGRILVGEDELVYGDEELLDLVHDLDVQDCCALLRYLDNQV